MQFDESSPRLEGFNAYYQHEIAGALEGLEARRKAALQNAAAVLVVAVAAIVSVWSLVEDGRAVLMLSFFIAVGGGGLAFYLTRGVKRDVKAHLVGKVCEFFGLSFVANPTGFPLDWFRELMLVPGYDRSRVEDNIAGSHEGVKLDFAEAHLKERRTGTGSKGRTEKDYVTVFRGLLCVFQFPKQFRGRTVVAREAGFLGKWFQAWGMPGERVRLEDPRFEDAFEVYGSDPAEARQLLTPTFMERILELDQRFGGKAVQLAFDADRLLVSIRQSGDRFEGGSIFTPVTSPERITRLLAEVALIYGIIDTLPAAAHP